MKEIATLKEAISYSDADKIEKWVHLFLQGEGDNIPFSEGLKLEKRYYVGPIKMPLSLFTRCCGPEKHLKYVIDKDGFLEKCFGD